MVRVVEHLVGYRAGREHVDRIEKVDDLTIKLFMRAPWAAFLAILTTQGGYVPAPEQLDDPEGSIHPIGTGPFKLVNWDLGKKMTLVKNPNYWRDGLPYLDNVEFRVFEDGASRISALEDGTLDVIHTSNFQDTAKLGRLDPKGFNIVHDTGATENVFVMFNTQKPPLDDVRVRQAVAYATDRDALATTNEWPNERLTDSPFASDSKWHTKVNFPRNDLDKARQLVS